MNTHARDAWRRDITQMAESVGKSAETLVRFRLFLNGILIFRQYASGLALALNFFYKLKDYIIPGTTFML